MCVCVYIALCHARLKSFNRQKKKQQQSYSIWRGKCSRQMLEYAEARVWRRVQVGITAAIKRPISFRIQFANIPLFFNVSPDCLVCLLTLQEVTPRRKSKKSTCFARSRFQKICDGARRSSNQPSVTSPKDSCQEWKVPTWSHKPPGKRTLLIISCYIFFSIVVFSLFE